MYTTGSSICPYFHPKTANGKKTVTVKEPSEDTDEDDEVPKFASWIIRFFSVTWPDAGYCKPVIEKAVAGFRSRPVLGRLREFSTRSRLLVKENIP